MKTTLLKARKCLRCLYEWFQRKPGQPLRCPKCNSPYWSKTRQRIKKESQENIKRESINNFIK